MGQLLWHCDEKENLCCASFNQDISKLFKHMLACEGHAVKTKRLEESLEKFLISLDTPAALRLTLMCCIFSNNNCAPKLVKEVRDDFIKIRRLGLCRGRLLWSATTAYKLMKKGGDAFEVKKNATQWAKKVMKLVL